jgi:hypothetical protein
VFGKRILQIRTYPPAMMAWSFYWRALILTFIYGIIVHYTGINAWLDLFIGILIYVVVIVFLLKFGNEKAMIEFYNKDDVLLYRFQKNRDENRSSQFKPPQPITKTNYINSRFCWAFLWRCVFYQCVLFFIVACVVIMVTVPLFLMGDMSRDVIPELVGKTVEYGIIIGSYPILYVAAFIALREIFNDFFSSYYARLVPKYRAVPAFK